MSRRDRRQWQALVRPAMRTPPKIPRPRREPGKMNGLERRYATEVLEIGRAFGRVLDWRFEAIAFRLAPSTFYHPDFFVVTQDRFEVHEVKGHWEDDARVKIKVAQQLNPYFCFVAVQSKKGVWSKEFFKVH